MVMLVVGVPTPEAREAIAVARDARVTNEAAVAAARVLTDRIRAIVGAPEVFAGRLAVAIMAHRKDTPEA